MKHANLKPISNVHQSIIFRTQGGQICQISQLLWCLTSHIIPFWHECSESQFWGTSDGPETRGIFSLWPLEGGEETARNSLLREWQPRCCIWHHQFICIRKVGDHWQPRGQNDLSNLKVLKVSKSIWKGSLGSSWISPSGTDGGTRSADGRLQDGLELDGNPLNASSGPTVSLEMELLWLSLSKSCDDFPGLEYIGGGG